MISSRSSVALPLKVTVCQSAQSRRLVLRWTRTRCPLAQDICAQEEPPLVTHDDGSTARAACHFALAPGESLLGRAEALGRTVSFRERAE